MRLYFMLTFRKHHDPHRRDAFLLPPRRSQFGFAQAKRPTLFTMARAKTGMLGKKHAPGMC